MTEFKDPFKILQDEVNKYILDGQSNCINELKLGFSLLNQSKWIDRRIKEIPKDLDVLVIWKGRIGVLFWDSDHGPFCSICPGEFSEVMQMNEECFEKVNYWMPTPLPVFRNDFPETSEEEYKPMPWAREWISKEEALKTWPQRGSDDDRMNSVNGDEISILPPENHEVKIRINYKWIIEEIIKRNGFICRNTTETLLKLEEEQK